MFRAIMCVVMVVALSATTLRANDTNDDGVVSILLPIAYQASQVIPGGHGSRWQMEMWLHNASSRAIDSLQPTGACFPPCEDFPSGFIGQVIAVHSNPGVGGALLVLPAADADDIHLSARLLETSRRAQPTGVELPVVREDAFLRGATTLLAIPVGSGIRSTLRVYDPRGLRGSSLRIEFLDAEGQVVATRRLRPGNDPALDQPTGPYRLLPGYDAILDVTSEITEVGAFERFHIRITPETAGMEYWAFVSVTDNESQHVLLISPRSLGSVHP